MSEIAVIRDRTAGWQMGRTFDVSLILGIVMIAALVAGTARLDPLYLELLVMADLWLLGYHHVIATFTKLAGTAADRQRNFALIWFLLPSLLFATFMVGQIYGVIAIVTIYFFWQWFHYVRQSWGIAQRYRHRSGAMGWDDVRLSEITLWSVPVWGVLNRCHQNPDTFLWMPVWMPPVPLWLVQVAGVASGLLVSWWVVTRLRAWQRGELAVGHTLYMLSHFVMFACAYALIGDITVGWLMVNVWHNTQYLVFVWMHNRQRFSSGMTSDGPVISWLSQPGVARATIYYGFCLLISTTVYYALANGYVLVADQVDLAGNNTGVTSITFLILFSMGINFHHYVVDSIIWKRKHEMKD